MSDKQILQESFNYLSIDLDRIETYEQGTDLPYQKHAIHDVRQSIFMCDPENGLLFLLEYIRRIDDLTNKIPAIVESLDVKEDFAGLFQGSGSTKSSSEIKEDIVSMLTKRLSYYRSELTRIQAKVEENLNELGPSRFASAGFKLKFDLKNGVIANIFKALLELKLLTTEDGSDLTQVKLAQFISRNFSSQQSNTIGLDSLKNLLGKQYSKESEEILTKLLKEISN